MNPLDTIRAAHHHSGLTVTEFAEASGITRAKLGEWLSRAKPNAKPRLVIYRPPTDAEVRLLVELAVTRAKKNHEQAVALLASLPAAP